MYKQKENYENLVPTGKEHYSLYWALKNEQHVDGSEQISKDPFRMTSYSLSRQNIILCRHKRHTLDEWVCGTDFSLIYKKSIIIIIIKKWYWRWLQIIIVTANTFRSTSPPATVSYFKTVVVLVHKVGLKLTALFPQHHMILKVFSQQTWYKRKPYVSQTRPWQHNKPIIARIIYQHLTNRLNCATFFWN